VANVYVTQWNYPIRRAIGLCSIIWLSTSTLQAWEEGQRKPSSAALSLLLVAAKRTDVLLDMLNEAPIG